MNLTKYMNLIKIVALLLLINILLKIPNQYFEDNFLAYHIFKSLIQTSILCFVIFKFKFKELLFFGRSTLWALVVGIFLLFLSISKMHSMLEAKGEFVPLSRHSLFVLSCLATGVFEELFFRFFVFNYLLKKLKKNLLFSIIVTSALFALAHLTNLFLSSYDTYSVINQTLFAFSIGIFLQVINIRTNSLVLVMFFHALINYWGSYRSKLVQIISETLSEQTFNDFLTSFISIILFSLLILLPLSWVLIRNKLETKTT